MNTTMMVTAMDTELKACPFCGPAVEEYAPKFNRKERCVICDICDAQGPFAHTMAEAIAAWNQRAKEQDDG